VFSLAANCLGIKWSGRRETVANDAHDFGVRDTVYVSVKTEGTGTGKLTAKWTFHRQVARRHNDGVGADRSNYPVLRDACWLLDVRAASIRGYGRSHWRYRRQFEPVTSSSERYGI
jgi:hypothetical protein